MTEEQPSSQHLDTQHNDLPNNGRWPREPFPPRDCKDIKQAVNELDSLLPATYRDKNNSIISAQASLEFLQCELRVKSLNAVQHFLWACGRPVPPRPLHHQILLSRQIVITENPELHLVWADKRIFLKPLPRYLLDKDFWKTQILDRSRDEERLEVEKCARGFLYSYCALIAYESDHRIARDKGLIPEKLEWEEWRNLAQLILQSQSYADINQRYWYGELRLSRLNKVYRFRLGRIFRGFSRVTGHAIYGDLVRDNFTTLASILGYVVIVLAAMQVGLATHKLEDNETFQNVSYGFTVFSIVAPLAATVAIFAFIFVWGVVNYRYAVKNEAQRFRDMGVIASWRVKSGEPSANCTRCRSGSA